MPDRHKHQPITFRPSEDDRAWLLAYADETGQPMRRVLSLALSAYRASVSGDTTAAAETPQTKPAAKTRRAPTRPHPVAATPGPAPRTTGKRAAKECAHTYPDVKFIAGRRVCTKCG